MRDDLEYEGQWDKLQVIRKKAENLGKDSKLVELGNAMNEYYQIFQNTLIDFKVDRANFETTQDENEVEQLDSIRVIKKEVIDMADIMDKMSGIIISQNKKLKEQN